jgi:hypothetical protein
MVPLTTISITVHHVDEYILIFNTYSKLEDQNRYGIESIRNVSILKGSSFSRDSQGNTVIWKKIPLIINQLRVDNFHTLKWIKTPNCAKNYIFSRKTIVEK